MSTDWFAESGSTGEVTVEERDGAWFLQSAESESDVKCIFEDDSSLSASSGPQRVSITVSNYMRGRGNEVNYLFASIGDDPSSSSSKATESSANRDGVAASNTDSGDTETRNPTRTLSELTGSGAYVTVEATVDEVSWVNKNDPETPDILGYLTDESAPEGVVFVVPEGVSHPYLGEGARFEFAGAKDHHYRAKDQVQLLITDATQFTQLASSDEGVHGSGRGDGRDRGRSPGDREKLGSLRDIAESAIGDETFVETQSGDDSLVGAAKRRARKQQRDPAIDPRTRALAEDEREGSNRDDD
ncbi:hypothetical protein C454_19814 [Haloferax gibbonsii ATCC 33959]|uniref:Uncharacterized protein n=1 Tax=Haloferax gibbonsii (strain ATCC 33959 / DSM 4427 / JCM 8863 / NBRC 102184 / NCIMB 2188 / Ma 2.38) TaxID=1227459 RepID=M0GUP3_HALGM|nr:hypothetical protein C454_19814 [Haloferax gibbonsii ATCC 33959]